MVRVGLRHGYSIVWSLRIETVLAWGATSDMCDINEIYLFSNIRVTDFNVSAKILLLWPGIQERRRESVPRWLSFRCANHKSHFLAERLGADSTTQLYVPIINATEEEYREGRRKRPGEKWRQITTLLLGEEEALSLAGTGFEQLRIQI